MDFDAVWPQLSAPFTSAVLCDRDSCVNFPFVAMHLCNYILHQRIALCTTALYFAPENHIVHHCIIFCTMRLHCALRTDCITLNYTKFKRGSLYSQDMTRGNRSPYLNIVHWQRTATLSLLLEIAHCVKYLSLVDATCPRRKRYNSCHKRCLLFM